MMFEQHPLFRPALLGMLVLQNTSVVLLGSYSRNQTVKENLYVVNHFIFMCEALKLVLSCVLEHNATGGKLYESIKANILDKPEDAVKISIPALLYLFQNSLLYVALANLSAPLFQVTYQTKLLTTAVLSVFLLARKYNPRQWVCLTSLGVGVAFVVLNAGSKKKDEDSTSTSEKSLFVGLVSVTVACMCSALAGVYFELVLKKPSTEGSVPVSVWMRNMQLAFFSCVIAFIQYIFLTGDDAQKPFMFGFNGWIWVLVWLQAGGGLLVAAIIKYADNVLKGMATGVSVVVSTFMSMLIFGTKLSMQFFMGAIIILTSVYFFSNEVPHALSSLLTKAKSEDVNKLENTNDAEKSMSPLLSEKK